MKKVGICTLYFADNFGAILQAFSLQNILQNLGHEVEFIKLKDFKGDINNYNSENFKKSQTYLNICSDIYDKDIHNYDTIIVGSDEMWNINNNSFEHLDEYFGYNFNCQNIISYAPTANGVTSETLRNIYNNRIDFSKFSNLSVRDKATQELVKEISNVDAKLVLDPTLLMDSFDPFVKYPDPNLKDYILIYGYNFSEDEKSKIIQFAKENNKEIYSLALGANPGWCKSLNADIYEFLGYFKNADYTITNTFHGLLFSLILEKEFAVFNNSSKLNDMIKKFNLHSRNAKNFDNLSTIFNHKVDYENINKLKLEQRNQSLEFLKEAI